MMRPQPATQVTLLRDNWRAGSSVFANAGLSIRTDRMG